MTEDVNMIPSAIAATAKGSLPIATNAEAANRLFSDMLKAVTKDCVKAGSWMIGHIKANVRTDNELLSMSSTTDDGNVRSRCSFTKGVKDYSMTVNVIVYGVERHKVAEILVSDMKKALGDIEITVHSEMGCEDPGCNDPVCQDKDHKRVITLR